METRVFNLIILDESGSMDCIKRQALSGVNETLQTIRAAQEKYPEQKQLVTFVPFQSGSIKFVRDCVNISEVKDLRDDEYNPGTCTPLYDAIGLSVNHLKSQVAPVDSVLVTIITDGYENDSKEFDAHAVSRLIEEMKGKGWLFTYIGANQDAIAVARALNIHNAMNFVQDDSGTKEMFRKERKARERFNAKTFEAHAEVMACCASMPSAVLEERLKTLNKSMAESANYFEEDSDV